MAMELFDGSYPKRECWPEDIVVPMCQSPKIADGLLLAGGVPANDDYLLVERGIKSRKSKSTFNAAWQTFLIVLCVIGLQLL
jgi:hypothetical protein